MKMTMNFFSSTIVTYLVLILMPGIEVGNIWTGILLAILLGIFNIIVKPALELLSIIPTLLTILLFLLIINGGILVMVDWFMDSFFVNSLGTVIMFSIIVTVANWGLHRYFRKKKQIKGITNSTLYKRLQSSSVQNQKVYKNSKQTLVESDI